MNSAVAGPAASRPAEQQVHDPAAADVLAAAPALRPNASLPPVYGLTPKGQASVAWTVGCSDGFGPGYV